MKSFLTAVIVFAVVISGTVISAVKISDIMNELTDLAESMPMEADIAVCLNELNKIEQTWNKYRLYADISVGNRAVHEIDDILREIRIYCESGDNTAYRASLSKFVLIMRDITESESFSADGIF